MTAAASAMPALTEPGREISRPITTGSVGVSGRATKVVAPNSPSATAKANALAPASALDMIGRSTDHHTRIGPAPSTAAACRSRSSAARSTGSTIRTTSGMVTIACAIGISSGDDRRSSGGASRAIRNPKPTVTALTPSGSITIASSPPIARRATRRRGRRASTTDSSTPISTDSAAAASAVRSEKPSAVGHRRHQHVVLADPGQRPVVVQAPAGRGLQRPDHQHGQRHRHQQRDDRR